MVSIMYITLTCMVRMSNRPRNKVTETKRSNAVLNKSADVLTKTIQLDRNIRIQNIKNNDKIEIQKYF